MNFNYRDSPRERDTRDIYMSLCHACHTDGTHVTGVTSHASHACHSHRVSSFGGKNKVRKLS
jgi:hypothetical protein